MGAFRKQVPFIASPNFQVGRGGHQVNGVVLHYTAGLQSLGWMQSPLSKVSAHFLIERDGTTTQMVDIADTAWHAGKATMPYQGRQSTNPNAFTVGIEIENLGLLHQQADGSFMAEVGGGLVPYPKNLAPPIQADLHWLSDGHSVSGWWEPYYEPQLTKLQWLLLELETDYGGILSNLMGHDEIATPAGRKQDPGPCMPWERLGREAKTLLVKSTYEHAPVVG